MLFYKNLRVFHKHTHKLTHFLFECRYSSNAVIRSERCLVKVLILFCLLDTPWEKFWQKYVFLFSISLLYDAQILYCLLQKVFVSNILFENFSFYRLQIDLKRTSTTLNRLFFVVSNQAHFHIIRQAVTPSLFHEIFHECCDFFRSGDAWSSTGGGVMSATKLFDENCTVKMLSSWWR